MKHTILEIEDYYGNTLHFIKLKIVDEKVEDVICDSLEIVDEEGNGRTMRHLRLQEVRK